MSGWIRWWRFNGVGALGIVLQVVALATLVRCGVPYPLATPAAVAIVLIHNFTWHSRWTWPTRYASAGALAAGFARFAAANGVVSLVAQTALTPFFVSMLRWPLIPANLAAVALSGLVNYWLAARIVFRVPRRLRDARPLA